MVVYAVQQTLGPGPHHRPGSIEARLGVNPATGVGVFNKDFVPAELHKYLPEFDARVTRGEREAARARRVADERAAEIDAKEQAIATLKSTGHPPDGFVVAHSATGASTTIGVSFDDGFVMLRAVDFETAASFGFRRANWPDAPQSDVQATLAPGTLPAEALCIVKPPAGATTELGVPLGDGGHRLVRLKDWPLLCKAGWQPSPWPPAP
jgi:hypothetical protein